MMRRYWKVLVPFLTGIIGLAAGAVLKEQQLAVISMTIAVISAEIVIIVVSQLSVMGQSIKRLTTSVMQLHTTLQTKTHTLKLGDIDLDDPVIRYHSTTVTQVFLDEIVRLGRKDLQLTFELNSDLRLRMVDHLQKSAFATLVVSALAHLWESSAWEAYRKACNQAARRLNGGFTRVFVIQDEADLTPRVDDLLLEHMRNKYDVRVARKDDLRARGVEPESDFGLWDDRWVTTLFVPEHPIGAGDYRARYMGYAEVLAHHRLLAEAITRASIPAKEFLNTVHTALNAGRTRPNMYWAQQSIHDEVIRRDPRFLDMMERNLGGGGGRILVIGSTAAILGKIRDLGLGPQTDVLDFFRHPSDLQAICSDASIGVRHTGLPELAAMKKGTYRAALSAGLFNHLTRWQIRYCARALKQVLQPEAVALVLGVIRDDETVGETLLDEGAIQTALHRLPTVTSPIRPSAQFLHVLDILLQSGAYDPRRATLDTGKWNDLVSKVPGWTLQPAFVCSIPCMTHIEQGMEPLFRHVETQSLQGDEVMSRYCKAVIFKHGK